MNSKIPSWIVGLLFLASALFGTVAAEHPWSGAGQTHVRQPPSPFPAIEGSIPLRSGAAKMRRLPAVSGGDRVDPMHAVFHSTDEQVWPTQNAYLRAMPEPSVAEFDPRGRSDSSLLAPIDFQDAAPAPLPPSNLQLPVSMHLAEVDVRQALELLSRSHGLNILVSPSVSGQVTANLEGLNVDQALHAILKLCNLVSVHEQGLVYVYSQAEFPRANLHVRVFPLDYISSAEILPTVQALLSEVGSISTTEINEEDNSHTREAIVVSDMESVLNRVEEYLVQIDLPPRQVMIEAHVLQINLADDTRHGVNFKQLLSAANSTLEVDITGLADPLASPAVFARIDGTDVDALLQILKNTTDAKTLASPRVMVVNGQKARIQVGEQLGYKVITVTENAAVEEVRFLEVGVVLEVTPKISRENRVLMRVKPEVSDGVINPDTLLPEEETSEMESDVLLDDGQGVVIGGLIQERNSLIQQKVPWLGDLHVIGKLFQRSTYQKERSEVVITLVPRIVGYGAAPTEREVMDAMRSQTPLLHGPLVPVHRPWEPRLPESMDNPHYLRDLRPGPCGFCAQPECDCESK